MLNFDFAMIVTAQRSKYCKYLIPFGMYFRYVGTHQPFWHESKLLDSLMVLLIWPNGRLLKTQMYIYVYTNGLKVTVMLCQILFPLRGLFCVYKNAKEHKCFLAKEAKVSFLLETFNLGYMMMCSRHILRRRLTWDKKPISKPKLGQGFHFIFPKYRTMIYVKQNNFNHFVTHL